jgi:hypothetical protein
MVFGARVAEALASGRTGPEATGVMAELLQARDSGSERQGSGPAGTRGEVPCTWVETDGEATGSVREPDTAAADDAPGVDVPGVDVQGDVVKLRALMQRSMTEGAGVSRSATSLDASARVVSAVRSRLSRLEVDRPTAELANLCDVSGALLIAAKMREETRGAHSRREFPESRPVWKRRLVHGRP